MDNFIQADIYTASQAIDGITGALTDYGITGFIISDSADFESFLADKNANWDYVDDELMGLSKVEPHITLYVHDNAQGAETLAAIRSLIESWKQNNSDGYYGNLRMELANVKEEDWANNWKKYYDVIHIGKIVIVPEWIDYAAKEGEAIVRIRPGAREHENVPEVSGRTGREGTGRRGRRLRKRNTVRGCREMRRKERLYDGPGRKRRKIFA